MLLSDFDFHLPDDLIAQEPLPDRAASRMLVVDRTTGKWEDRMFRDFPTYLHPNDCLVLNDSRVLPSRLYGHREHGTGRVELLLTKPISADGLTWEALVRPGRKLPTGERIVISDDLTAEILDRAEFGERLVRLHPVGNLFDVLDRVGGLLEEERRLPIRVGAHLDGVRAVVAPDAVDAAHRIELIRARDGDVARLDGEGRTRP